MAALFGAAKRKQKAAGAKPNMLCIEDQLLMMLEYWREYRTYFHIGQAYGLSESAAYRNIKGCENTLAKARPFTCRGARPLRRASASLTLFLSAQPRHPSNGPKKTKALLLKQEEAAR